MSFKVMSEDSDQESTDLEICSKTWNKIEKNVKLIGFQEGAAKGKEISLQHGFNLGYSDGFRIGEQLGLVKGIISCQKQLALSNNSNLDFNESDIDDFINKACVLCSEEKNKEATISEETDPEKFEDLVSRQQDQNNKIIKNFENFNFNLQPD